MKNTKWYIEETTENEILLHSLREIIYSGSSPYQRIEVIRTGNMGKCLYLDGKIQSSEMDEFIYHEALVHPAMFLCNSPKVVLIAGGGEGATIREVLKHPVNEVIMVDLDEEVINISKKFLPEWSNGAFDDPRVKLVIDDARAYIEGMKDYFDVIIIDLPEPTEGGPAYLLYTKEFYEKIYKALKKDGIMVTQSASTAINNLSVFVSIIKTIKAIFPYVKPYIANIPSFFAPWGFVLASKVINPDKIDLKEKISNFEENLRFFDLDAYLGMFSLPKYIKKAINEGGVVIRDDSPLSFY
ncbi:MAG: polyamine aminopropyltransferase [Thermodesulfovibrio sp.]|nr:polyamine aminopropyltransferase [Thermodesulfovibrio sp.]